MLLCSSVVLGFALLVVAAVEVIHREPVFPESSGTRDLTLDVLERNKDVFQRDRYGLDWLEWADVSPDKSHDAYRTYLSSSGNLIEENLISATKRTIMQAPPKATGYSLNADKTVALFAVNVTQNYRYSSFANYQVQDVKTKIVQSLDPDQNGDIQYAVWSPTQPTVLGFVKNNNIYLWNAGEISPVTHDGSATLFHGVPDWVYEEEMLMSRSALWFSPDGTHIAWLSFDDSEVPVYTVPYYMNGNKYAKPYPKEKKIRYPKPGAVNPTVKASVFNIDTRVTAKIPLAVSSFSPENLIVGELVWMTNNHDKLIIRCFNRVQNVARHLLYNVNTLGTTEVRRRIESDGWLENTKSMKWIGQILSGRYASNGTSYYLDVSDQDGWQHIYLHAVDSEKSWQLTKGEWEVRRISSVDVQRGLVYFTSTERHPTESHPFSVSFFTGEKKEVAQARLPGFYEISVSSRNQHMLLLYTGPNVPYSQLYSLNSTDTPIRTIDSGDGMKKILQQVKLPRISYIDLLHPSGYNLSAKMIFPPNFSTSKKFPVLFTPYGGPNSQQVTKQMGMFSNSLFAVTDPALEYITYTVDNRGTGFRGRNFRNVYYKAMGVVDADDQIWAARELAKNPWVDKDKIGIWGWSHGGYLSAKVIEKNSGVFSFAIATAPTTDSRLYDSMFMYPNLQRGQEHMLSFLPAYTSDLRLRERYMGIPQWNQSVYDQAAITNPAGFLNVKGSVLIQHGTGDDNVHFQHTAGLVDLLMGAQVPPEKMQAQFFPDSDHQIAYNKAGTFQSRQLKMKLLEEKHRVVVSESQEGNVDIVEFADQSIERGIHNGMKEIRGENRKQIVGYNMS
ncbi:hypothetical protein EJ08DRAFT_680745 [Tothia fuscella]|uniref:dipeptidyl-peptidase IV n=1 Tax=Tothia fuscella TaxID=1048955 RepID=A0A9P4TWY2_9PEZI|nr:hypothetical protein EJ08DRAFT_680745 [Tothia fuscella]